MKIRSAESGCFHSLTCHSIDHHMHRTTTLRMQHNFYSRAFVSISSGNIHEFVSIEALVKNIYDQYIARII